jgi:hypothetical protein
VPTIGLAARWIADLGGYTGRSSGDPPGSIVIRRGLFWIAPAVLLAKKRYENQINAQDSVVDACEPENDPHDWKGWYRSKLMKDDGAIDRIWRKLLRSAETLPSRQPKERKAVAAALSYLRKRGPKMRYAMLAAAHLPIASGASEITCWHTQCRVQRPGQSWQVPGLRPVMSVRTLVLSDRWQSAWHPYTASCRKEIKCVA